MIKRTLLASIVAAFAFVALPALALANPTLDPKGTGSFPTHFTSHGGKTRLQTTNLGVTCETVTNTGEFENGQTGWIEFTFHECHDETFGIPCTTGEDPEGTITTGKLYFHLKTVEHGGEKSDAVLITPSEEEKFGKGLFAEFDCSFLVHVNVVGNGIIGTITTPTNEESTEATVSFEPAERGVQTHREVTDNPGVEYDLKAVTNGNAEEIETASQEGEGTLTFPDKAVLT